MFYRLCRLMPWQFDRFTPKSSISKLSVSMHISPDIAFSGAIFIIRCYRTTQFSTYLQVKIVKPYSYILMYLYVQRYLPRPSLEWANCSGFLAATESE